MRIVVVSCVRDEADIIEAFVRHAAAFAVRVLVLDHGSTDATPRILAALKAEGLPLDVVRDEVPGRYGRQRYTRLMREAFDRHGADWVMPLDADEFPDADPRNDPAFAEPVPTPPPDGGPPDPHAAPCDGVVQVRQTICHTRPPTDDDAGPNDNVLQRIRSVRRRDDLPVKIAVHRSVGVHPDAMIEQGNHSLHLPVGRPVTPARTAAFRLWHVAYRSPLQTASKILVARLQYLTHVDRNTAWGGIYFINADDLPDNPAAVIRRLMTEGPRGYSPNVTVPTEPPGPNPYLGGPLRHTPAVPVDLAANLAGLAEQFARCIAALRMAGAGDVDAGRLAASMAEFGTLEQQASRALAKLGRERLERAAEAGTVGTRASDAATKAVAADLRLAHELGVAAARLTEARLRSSLTWRLGRLLVGPIAWLRRLLGGGDAGRGTAMPAAGDAGPLAWADSPRVVVGSGGLELPGWACTDRRQLDVTRPEHFARLWMPASRTHFFAEHVWEHLDPGAAAAGARNCRDFLRPGGRLRLAVPDGLHPDPAYRKWVDVGGVGPGSEDHRILHDVGSLTTLLEDAGFRVVPLEWWDGAGRFHRRAWDDDDGPVRRCPAKDAWRRPGIRAYTSLIVDAFRPGGGVAGAGPELPETDLAGLTAEIEARLGPHPDLPAKG